MKHIITLAIFAICVLQAQGIVVSNTAGKLSERVSNLNVTDLTVTGTMNAEDFYFISGNLHELTTLDISAVNIEPCSSSRRHYLRLGFGAGEIPVCAFADMKLTNVVLPTGATAINEGAFAGCSHLTSVTFPTQLDIIGGYAFAGCTSLPAVTLPATVTEVGDGAFMRCTSLVSLKVQSPGQLKTLGEAALMDCPQLTEVVLGSGLLSTGERLLAGSGVGTLDLTASSRLSTLGGWMMVQTPVTTVKLPSSLETMGDGAFLYAKDLTSLTLGSKLKNVGNYAMAGTGLTGDIAFDGLSRLGDYALYNVSDLSQVSLSASTVWLGDSAMAGMTGLEALTCRATKVPELGENVWAGVDQQSIPLTVPVSSVELYKAADQWKEFFFEEQQTWLRGDVNNDGEVNIADINLLIDIILGGQADEATMRRADVNQDNEVGIADINSVVDIILSPSSHAPAVIDTDDLLNLDDLAIQPGEERTITIRLENAEAYSALQCDVTLPQGLSLIDGSVAVGASAKGHTSETRDIDAATTRTVVYSMSKRQFDGEGNAVITMTVRADATLATESLITLSNIVLAGADNKARYAADYAARVTSYSGVEDLTASVDRVWAEGHNLCIETRLNGNARLVAINGESRQVALSEGVNRYMLEPGFYVVIVNNKSYKIVIK